MDCSVAFPHELAIITQRTILANCTIVGLHSEKVMAGKDAETELTLGNAASASLGKTQRWDGPRWEAVTPVHDTTCTMDTELQRPQDCSKS